MQLFPDASQRQSKNGRPSAIALYRDFSTDNADAVVPGILNRVAIGALD
jgi:hypothetical protein